MVNLANILMTLFFASGQSIGVTWSPPPNPGGTVTYNVYRSHNGAGYVLTPHQGVKGRYVAISGGLVNGEVECIKITGIVNGVESPFSPQTCITWQGATSN